AMARGDAVRLQSIPGVGKKTAERIALELKDKAAKLTGDLDIAPARPPAGEHQETIDDALSALANLGYPAKSAQKAVEMALSLVQEVNLESLIKEALRRLA
ncbi:MAG: Holliday junction branch migration protein RuvA, partial [Deltaproteobacteria bacterium]|nr:Holliday junction branch migration protein RuvA [Deltaproteobacteria bacterium]